MPWRPIATNLCNQVHHLKISRVELAGTVEQWDLRLESFLLLR